MPWSVKKASGGGWNIVKSTTGEVVGHSDTEEKAKASVRARYASVHGENLSEPKNMAKLEYAVVTCHELNELEDSGWDVQSVVVSKDVAPTRDMAIKKIAGMGFAHSTVRETGDEDEGSWRFRQRSSEEFTKFRNKPITDGVTLVYGELKQ